LLDGVVGNYLDSVTEREFDAPLLAVVRAQGFADVHLLHGQYEFGKDVIAKTASDPVTQYVFQSKAGNIALADWAAMRGQLDLLRTNELAHPGFDRNLPRQAVLMVTGRLTGAAPLEAQDYIRQAEERGETPLEVWDRERLIELLATSPEAALATTAEGPFLELIGRIDAGRVAEGDIEEFSRRWVAGSEPLAWPSVIEASIIATRLRETDRLDLACYTALALLRSVWASAHEIDPLPEEVLEQVEVSRKMFIEYAGELWSRCSDEMFEPKNLIGSDTEGVFVTYPVRCMRLAELVGLYGLALDGEDRRRVAEWLSNFLSAQPGATHPISDRWAVSLLPPMALIHSAVSSDFEEQLLRELVRWLGDRYQNDGLGLAAADAPPDEEVEYLLGASLEHVSRERRGTSYLAAVILDLASALELPELYDVAYNDIEAVGASPAVPLPNDDVSQYLVAGEGVNVPLDTSPRYAEKWSESDGWRMAAHQDDDRGRFLLGRLERFWDQLAVSLVTRDRHWVAGFRALASS
jgi:hypothetical protein